MLKKIRLILLAVILLMQSGGMLLLHQMQIGLVKYEMRQMLSRTERSEKFIFSLSEYQMSKINEREILLNGKMYDVKSAVIAGNVVEVLAIHDTKEQSIIGKISEEICRGTCQDKRLPEQLVKLLVLLYNCPQTDSGLLAQIVCPCVFPAFSDCLVAQASDIPSPPPEII